MSVRSNRRTALVIWDCDGCLVDSETLACEVATKILNDAGNPITRQEFIDRFTGQSWKTIRETMCDELGEAFAARFSLPTISRATEALFATHLHAIPYVAEAIDKIGLPVCVASGSELSRIRQSLSVTGLASRFGENLFSARQVARGKPAPDIFLYAAKKMGVDPERCLVIEDSPFGIQAAQAAHMPVFAFLGASHVSANWRARVQSTGVRTIFTDMRHLPLLVDNNL